MESYFKQMNEEYIDKHYPGRSIFSSIHKSAKKGGMAVFIFFGTLLAASGFGSAWSIMQTIGYKNSGDSDMADVGMVISVVCILVFLLSIFVIWLVAKKSSLKPEDLIKQCAKNSQYSESDIHEFEQQAMMSDSLILEFAGKMKSIVTGQKDGVLTRDFIFLADLQNTVMKLDDIIGALLVERTYYMTVNNKNKMVHYLTITLLSSKNTVAVAETSQEIGAALISLLQEKNPQIDTNDGGILHEDHFDKYRKGVLVAHS